MMARNVTTLAKYAGQDFRLVYPLDGGERPGEAQYEASARMTLYRSVRVEILPLPPGTYELEYVVIDRFYRPITMDRTEMVWDGENAVFTGVDEWSGVTELVWMGWEKDRQ